MLLKRLPTVKNRSYHIRGDSQGYLVGNDNAFKPTDASLCAYIHFKVHGGIPIHLVGAFLQTDAGFLVVSQNNKRKNSVLILCK